MRVLLYVEPFPIRDTLTHFDGVAREFLPLLSAPAGYDIRMFANNATFDALKGKVEAHNDKLIRSTRAEEDYLRDCLKLPWATEGLPVWGDLMAGKGEVSDRHVQMLRRIWNLFPFEVIVHWGENGAVTRFLDERPVTRVAMELGCTRPPFFNSVVMDPFGTNGSAILPKLGLEDIRDIVEDKPMSRHDALLGFSNNISAPGYGMQFAPIAGELDTRWADKKIAYLPLQLFDDANLLRFSPYDSLTDVVLDVVPRLANAGYTIVIKPHPASKHRNGSSYETMFARRAVAPWANSIVWCPEEVTVTNARFFSLADVVVTVNSSVGFEALYYDKPVVVLGDAVYKPKGIFPTLDDILADKFNREAYLKAIALLRRFVLGGYIQPHSLRSNVDSFCQRVSLIHQIWQSRQGDPAAFARDYWRACAPAQQAMARSSMIWGISRPGVSEFGVPAAVSSSEAARKLPSAGRDAKTKPLLPLWTVSRLRSFWGVWRAGEWIKEHWATNAGRTEVVKLGQVIDAAYYIEKYPDLKATGVDPVEHYLAAGLNEGRSPQAHITPGSPDIILDGLLACRDRLCNVIKGKTADDERGTEERAAFEVIFSRICQHVEKSEVVSLQEWLVSVWADRTMRAELIQVAQVLSPSYYLQKYPDIVAAGVDPTEHYAWTGVDEARSPREGIENPQARVLLDVLIATCDLADDQSALKEYPLPEDQQSMREKALAAVESATATKRSRVAVVAHLYYTDVVPEILERLRSIKEPFDFYVTLPDWGTRRTQELVRSAYPDAVFYPAANRGRDIGPFMDLLPLLIAKDYDAVLKVQTKRGYFRAGKMVREFGEIWRHETFDALIGSPDRVAAILGGFRSNPGLNAVGPQPFLFSLDAYPYHDGGALADGMFGAERSDASLFFGGTMFWVRPSSLRDMARITLTHFAEEDGANDGALAHLVERMFGDAVTARGGLVAAAPVDPSEPLNFEPAALTLTIDAYFTERQKLLQAAKTTKTEGALIW